MDGGYVRISGFNTIEKCVVTPVIKNIIRSDKYIIFTVIKYLEKPRFFFFFVFTLVIFTTSDDVIIWEI